MLISYGFDISLKIAIETAVLFSLRVHPSRQNDIVGTEELSIEPKLSVESFIDSFGNHCDRVKSPPGILRISCKGIIQDSGELDPYAPNAIQQDVCDLPTDCLQFLLPSRYCEVDSELATVAWENFQSIQGGWHRVQAISDFVNEYITFDYMKARGTRTALETYNERIGVCRDFTHLAIALCRCMNIPARYVTGYLGNIGVPPEDYPMDFSTWMEVYLDGKWYPFDPRNRHRRIGRIVIAYGRDASDVAIATVFGQQSLEKFMVYTDEIDESSPLAIEIRNEIKLTHKVSAETCMSTA